jgi:hypothetical protein
MSIIDKNMDVGGGSGGVESVNGKTGTVVLYGTNIKTDSDPNAPNIDVAINDALQSAKSYADAQIENAELSKQIWLPAVQTLAELEAITPPEPDKTNYLCRVMNDTDKDNNGVWQWIAGATTWTYFSDNLDFVDETELEEAINTHNTDTEAHEDIRTLIDNKLDKKTTSGDYVYIHNGTSQNEKAYTLAPIPSTIAERTNSGTLRGATATDNNDLVNLSQMNTAVEDLEEEIDNKVDKVSANSKVYGTSSTGEQTTYDLFSFGAVDDVKVDGESVVTNKIASIDLTGKVDKETGKGLSSNDFTDGDKAKVDDIATLQTAITKLNTVYTCPVANIPFNTTNFETMADGITDGKTFLLRRNGKICTISMDVKSKIEFAINTNIKVATALPTGYSPVTGAKAPAMAYLTDGATAYAGNIRYSMNTGQCYFFFGGTPFPAGGRIFCNVTYVTNDDYPSS